MREPDLQEQGAFFLLEGWNAFFFLPLLIATPIPSLPPLPPASAVTARACRWLCRATALPGTAGPTRAVAMCVGCVSARHRARRPCCGAVHVHEASPSPPLPSLSRALHGSTTTPERPVHAAAAHAAAVSRCRIGAPCERARVLPAGGQRGLRGRRRKGGGGRRPRRGASPAPTAAALAGGEGATRRWEGEQRA